MVLGSSGSRHWRIVVLWLVAAPGTARAEAADRAGTLGLTVDFSGPASCGAPNRLLEKARALLEGSNTPEVHVDAQVGQVGDRVSLRLQLSGAVSGERELQARNCEEALEAGAVVIAWAIDPDVASRRQTATAAPTIERSATDQGSGQEADADAPTETATAPASTEAVDETEPVDVDEVDPLPARPMAVRPVVSVASRVGTGLVQTLGVGAQLGIGVEMNAVRLSGHAHYDLARQRNTPEAGPVRFHDRGAGLRLCGRLLRERMAGLYLCGGADVAWVTARAERLDNAEERHASLYSIVGEGLFVWRVMPPLRLSTSAGIQVPTTRPRFTVTTSEGDSRVLLEPETGWIGVLGAEFEL